MKILYFAWLRERIGVSSEDLAVPETAKTINDVVAWLRTREPRYEAAFEDMSSIRAALDQEAADLDTPIGDARELALFPPVTGG